MDLSEHARINRDEWNRFAPEYVADADRNWATTDATS